MIAVLFYASFQSYYESKVFFETEVLTSKLTTESWLSANDYSPLIQLLVKWCDVSPDWFVCDVDLALHVTLWQWNTLASDASHVKNRKSLKRNKAFHNQRSRTHKITLSANDDKRIIQPNKIQTLAHGFRGWGQTERPKGKQRGPGKDKGGLVNRGGLAGRARGFDRDRGTHRVQAKTPQN